jgi:hypothetical protein
MTEYITAYICGICGFSSYDEDEVRKHKLMHIHTSGEDE